jgi:hypothetical protein
MAAGWTPSHGSGLVVQRDLTPAAWIESSLPDDAGHTVGGLVPGGFGGYARVFFPFVITGPPRGQGREERITWTEMARRNGRVAHAVMHRQDILLEDQDHDENLTWYADMAPEQFSALVAVLARHTSSAGSWFLLWGGHGDLDSRAFSPWPTAQHGGSDYYLLHGQHRAYEDFSSAPDFWWPEDRAWCVCTHADIDWAYVAGSAACIQEILALPVIDAQPTKLQDPLPSME